MLVVGWSSPLEMKMSVSREVAIARERRAVLEANG